MLIDALTILGPCLSTDLADHLMKVHGLSAEAARQRVSRAPADVRRLGHLPFPRKARFVYLQSQFASDSYWTNLYKAIYETKGAYAKALGAVEARVVVPLEHFMIACGAPIAQKKHISADSVLQRLVSANVLVIEPLPGIGKCIMTKQTSEDYDGRREELLAKTSARLLAESILLDSLKEWLRRLALVSYHKVSLRTPTQASPKIGTFCWDLAAPSYISALSTWTRGSAPSIKPGWVVCDVLLNHEARLEHIEAFIYKAQSTVALKNVGKAIFIFVAERYDSSAFNELRKAGIVPATPESLFGKEIADAFSQLSKTLERAALGSLDPVKFDDLFSRLSKLEGAVGNMRGAFFELLVAEVVRKNSPADVQLNKICKTPAGEAEVDVWEYKDGIVSRMIECKGISPNTLVEDKEIELWITKRIPNIRKYLEKQGWAEPKPKFELWTSGGLSDAAKKRIEKTKKANSKKFEIEVLGPEEIRRITKKTKDKSLLKTIENHFIPPN